MARLVIPSLILILQLTFAFGQQHQFEILGTATGFENNTLLYLDHTCEGDRKIDSTYVIGRSFTFKGTVKSSAVYALLRTQNYSDYKFFWIESGTIQFEAKKGGFRKATVTGSKTQDEQNKLNLSLENSSETERSNIEKRFVKESPNSIISAHLLGSYASTWGKDTATLLFDNLSIKLKNTSYGRSIAEFIALNKNVKVGDRYADFTQNDTKNNPVKLSDFNGKVVLLEFWGSWCGPCRQSNPGLVEVYNEFKNMGFEILGVGAETNRETWLKAIERDKLSWTNVSDLKGDKNTAALIYGISYYPTNFLIDKNGIIVAKDLKGDKLRRKLKQLLAE